MSSKRILSGVAVSSNSKLDGATNNGDSLSPPPNKQPKQVAVVLDLPPTARAPRGGSVTASYSNNTATGFPPPKITILYVNMNGKAHRVTV